MLPTVQKDILALLPKVLDAMRDEDILALGQLSNHTIHDASIYQDEDSLSFAILVYALSKVVGRCCEANISYQSLFPPLQNALSALKRNEELAYRQHIKGVFSLVQRADAKLKLYVQEVIEQAKVKKGSRIHEHGISLAKTAELLGISQWELQGFVGRQVVENDALSRAVAKRLAFARGLFGQKVVARV